MLEERNRIENSHSMADNVLAQAYSIQETFGLQRETLISIQRKIQTAAEKVPGMNQLISRIGSRKRRDGIIMGGFVAFCFLILLFFR